MKIAVVGAGLFGCIVARHLMGLGHTVTMLDSREAGGGSLPAACLMKPGWLSKVPRLDEVFNLLDQYYGLQELSFSVNNMLNQKVMWVDPRRVLSMGHVYRTKVVGVDTKLGIIETEREQFLMDHIVVAAGVWAKALCPWVPVEPRWGTAFLWPEHRESHVPPFISQWAPYKQVVAFQRGDGLWAGDGSALKTIDSEREAAMLQRCQEKLDIWTKPTYLRGQRPYVSFNSPGAPCWLEHRGKVTVATGGAKNGTAAAGFCALKIGEHLGRA